MQTAALDKEINAILNAIEIGVYGVDSTGRCTFINKAALDVLGYSQEEVLGSNMHELIHHTYPDGTRYPESACPLLQTLETGRPVQLDNELIWRKDGSFFTADYSAFPVLDEDAVTGSVITFQDTAHRGQARKRLAVQVSVSRILAGSSDLDVAMTQVLSAIGAALGWHVAVFWEVDPKNGVLRSAASWPGAEASGAEFLAETQDITFVRGAGLPGRVWQAETAAHIANVASDPDFSRGEAAAKAGLRSAFAFPLRTGTQTVGVMEFFSRRWQHFDDDFLESVATLGQQIGQYLRRKRAEEDLRESEALKAAILETSLDCVISITADSRIVEWNAAAERTFGYTRDEVLGKLMPELIIPEEHRTRHYEGVARFLETGHGRLLGKRIEIEAVRRDGRRFPVELAITSASMRAAPHFTAYVRDITARKGYERDLAAAKEEAEEANRAKSQFIANMSHELRTPLTAVIGYGEMLEEEAQDRGLDMMLDDLRKVNANARHLLSLINDVLDISKIEAGKTEIHVETFDVCALVRELQSAVEALVEKNRNSLTIDCADDIGHMTSDPVKVRQCIINLLSNAAKFTHDGSVRLEVSRDRDTLVFRVTDTGVGMTPEQLAKLFQRFSQADASTTRRFGGTGLGLSITKAFASMLGGDISVNSEIGRGTTFTLELPADSAASAAAGHDPTGVTQGEDSPLPCDANVVLVIDDDPHARALLTRFLLREGFVVRTAADGESGLSLARALHPRAILLDVMMPHMDGWAVLSALKADPELADIPVVMETIVQERGLAFSLGAADYVTKPIHWPRLKRVLDKFRSSAPPHALIVDDDDSTRGLLQELLEKEGWSVLHADDSTAAFESLARNRPALVLVDLNMRRTNAFALIRELRKGAHYRDMPVVALSAHELTPEERGRLDGYVQQIIDSAEDTPTAILGLLRRIPASTRASRDNASPAAPENAHGYDTVG